MLCFVCWLIEVDRVLVVIAMLANLSGASVNLWTIFGGLFSETLSYTL